MHIWCVASIVGRSLQCKKPVCGRHWCYGNGNSTEEGRQRTKNHLTVALPFLIYVVIISLKGVYDLNPSDFMQIAPIL